MKRKMTIALAALTATMASLASAEVKIATLDVEKIVDLHPETVRNREILKETLGDYQEEIARLEDAYTAARKAASAAIEESRNPALGEKARKRAEEEAEKSVEIARSAERDFAEKRAERQRNLNEQEERMLRITIRQIQDEVEKYAKANGIVAVLPVKSGRLGIASAAVWADDSIDITRAIMAAMGIEEKANGSDTAGSGAAKAATGE